MTTHKPVRHIREWREKVFYMSQKEFAEKIAVNESTLSLWETGKRQPYPRKQRLVAEALGIQPWQILFGPPLDEQGKGTPAAG